MIQLLNPIWLWGLTGLLIPVAIHLLSRKEGKIIHFGSLRHLTESNTARFRTLRLNELLLLFIRCLLLALLVLLIAGLQFNFLNREKQKWFVIENGIEKLPQFKILFDSLEKQGYEAHYLISGFPTVRTSLNDSVVQHQQNYWLLMEELRSKSLSDIIIASYSYAKNYMGERIALPENMRWILFEPSSSSFPVEGIQLSPDSILTRIAYSTATATSFETKKHSFLDRQYFKFNHDSVSISARDSIIITIVNDNEFEYDQKVILASLKAIQSITPHKLIVNTYSIDRWNQDPDYDWLILLTDKIHILSSVIRKKDDVFNDNIIAYRNCTSGNLPLLIRGAYAIFSCEEANELAWIITKRLNEETALKENVSVLLAKIILGESSSYYFHEQDKRVLPEGMLWSTSNENLANVEGELNQKAEPYLVILIFITLLAERLLAYKRNQ